MTDTQLNALREFARLHGADWKHHLHLLWLSGKDAGTLRQIRNNYLPLVMSNKFNLEGV